MFVVYKIRNLKGLVDWQSLYLSPGRGITYVNGVGIVCFIVVFFFKGILSSRSLERLLL